MTPHFSSTLASSIGEKVPAVRLVSEAKLAAQGAMVTTGVMVDIGESGSYVTPIFDGVPVAKAARWIPCGGGDVTAFLDSMLMSRANEEFNQLVRAYPTNQRRTVQASQRLCAEIHSSAEMLTPNDGALFFCYFIYLFVTL